MPRLLIIEDEPAMRTALTDLLIAEGHRILTASDGASGLDRALTEKPDLILLDVMLPKRDGFSLVAELRRHGHQEPVLMLTARGHVGDRVHGLNCGADDYLAKPFSTDELLARVRALLRRSTRTAGAVPESLTLGDVCLHFTRFTATRAGTELHLTPKEWALLKLLAESEGEPVTRQRALDVVWGVNAYPTTRTVDTHIACLRSKIEIDPENPRHLRTVHGIGYMLTFHNSLTT